MTRFREPDNNMQVITALQEHNATGNIKVNLVVIPLGVAGTIYTSTKTGLQDKLGVTWPVLTKLLRNLHFHAIRTLTRIITYRCIMMGPRTGPSSCTHSTSAAASNAAPAQTDKRAAKRRATRIVRFRPQKRQKH